MQISCKKHHVDVGVVLEKNGCNIYTCNLYLQYKWILHTGCIGDVNLIKEFFLNLIMNVKFDMIRNIAV